MEDHSNPHPPTIDDDPHTEAEIDYANPPFPLTASDKSQLAMSDADFHTTTWPELRHILSTNALARLQRRPSDLRRYLAWSHGVKQRYGSVSAFVIAERLRWTTTPQSSPRSSSSAATFAHRSGIPFAHPADYAVLPNDWPYGVEGGVAHLVAWSKTPIAVDAERGGDVTAAARGAIDEFVQRYFVRELGPGGAGRVMWFKNWAGLQSIGGVDHVHVLVKDAPVELLEKWTRRRDIEPE